MKIKSLSKTFFLLSSFLCSSMGHAAQSLHIYAASSMTNAMDTLAKQYEKTHSEIDIVPVYGGSSTLARQIEQGAPADIFISANTKWMDFLEQKRAQEDLPIHVKPVLTNELVLIANKKNQTNQHSENTKMNWDQLPQMLGKSRLAIGMPQSVPAGIYTKQSLESLKLWERLENKLAPTNNVRLAMALVERGEASYGSVYKSDAKMSDKVVIIAKFPKDSHDPIIYPFARLNTDKATKEFYQYLQSDNAIKVFEQYGFKSSL